MADIHDDFERAARDVMSGEYDRCNVRCTCYLGQCQIHAPCRHPWWHTRPGDEEGTYICPECDAAEVTL